MAGTLNVSSAWFDITCLPSRSAYLIRAGSRSGFRRAIQEASGRWGGMAEPVIAVRVGGKIDPWYEQLLEVSDVAVLVAVDISAEEAGTVGKRVGLPCVELEHIDRVPVSASTMHPLALLTDEPAQIPVIAGERSPLWHAVAAGDLADDHLKMLQQEQIEVVKLSGDGQIAHSALRGTTMLERTVVQFGEDRTEGGLGSTPAVI
ncbi:hypothetical protein FHS29_002994 [Saccharothrix tamanrassetensis]|uniref:Uncharacterized protein n=1 Tax=Saccharothrix tamanrassetensis TaxID=1051531 RepID=A0A841CJQ4_9PSEU|nr:hypothetical protein [Saccharothrix tamanrassetensis]MBB5956408.1 hypothetical protein [Saccharothrix tamanrassetensis]